MSFKALIHTVAPYFKPYIEIHSLTGENYYFRKESTSLREADGKKRNWHPHVKHTMLRSHHSPAEGILYAAFRKEARLNKLQQDDFLYIGCSAKGGARYWRGRPSPVGRFAEPKSCFHHEQMRRGRNGSNLETYLSQVGSIIIYTLTDAEVITIVQEHNIVLPPGKYPSHQLERAVLAEGFLAWKWNARS